MENAAQDSILVIDDKPDILEVIVEALKQGGYAPLSGSDPQEAMKLLETTTFDVIISDIVMPHLHGLELLQLVKARDPHVQVLLITAYGAREVALEASAKGAFRFLVKPFDLDELLAAVRVAVLRARAGRRLPRTA